MTDKFPVLPIAGATLGRAFLTVLAFLTRWLKSFARARRHRREAAALAGLDRRMLADIGISSSDVDDAFSMPFWEDPTVLLNARVCERRNYRDTVHRFPTPSEQAAFRRRTIDRRVRYTF
jgi:uncharacterized protein YjiS (DUF1127 family)